MLPRCMQIANFGTYLTPSSVYTQTKNKTFPKSLSKHMTKYVSKSPHYSVICSFVGKNNREFLPTKNRDFVSTVNQDLGQTKDETLDQQKIGISGQQKGHTFALQIDDRKDRKKWHKLLPKHYSF
jgi:hypothetical protein